MFYVIGDASKLFQMSFFIFLQLNRNLYRPYLLCPLPSNIVFTYGFGNPAISMFVFTLWDKIKFPVCFLELFIKVRTSDKDIITSCLTVC